MFNANIDVIDLDFIEIRFNRLQPSIIREPIENVVITSKNAVEALLINFSSDELNFNNVFCVGRKTKALIEKKIGKVAHQEKNAEKLANYLIEGIKTKEVTFFSGNLRRDELPLLLTKNNILVNEVEVYRTLLRPHQIEDDLRGVLFFSPTGIKSFTEINAFNDIDSFCIGNTTANESKKYFKNVNVANVPTVESVIELVNNYYVSD